MKRVFITSLIVLALAFSASAQDKVVKKVLELGKEDNRTMEHADFLSNRIGGRVVGSHALQDAEAWVAEQFKSWGLEVMIQEVGEIPVGFTRGHWAGRMIGEGGEMHLHFATPSYTAGTKGPQKGRVFMEPRTRAEFERMKSVLKGSWVLIGGTSNGFPTDWSAQGDSIRREKIAKNEEIAKRNNEVMMWNYQHRDQQKELEKYDETPCLFYREMVEAGVLGFIQSSGLPIQAHYDRKGCYNITMENLPTVCEIKLDREQYDIIAQKVKDKRDIQLEFDIRNYFFRGPVKYHNVIGIIRGAKYPKEYVLLGGHLDAYDSATGAVDDGHGVAVTMEAARLLAAAGAKPARTMMFCVWTGEEYGLLGSKYFVENKTVPYEKIANYFNRDGGPLASVGIDVPSAMYQDFVKICKPLENYDESMPFSVTERKGEPRPRPKSAGGSDHAYFAMNGVPTISFAERDVKGYNFNYRDIWHTDQDLYYRLYPDYIEYSAVVEAVTAYGVANLDHLLSREGLYKE